VEVGKYSGSCKVSNRAGREFGSEAGSRTRRTIFGLEESKGSARYRYFAVQWVRMKAGDRSFTDFETW